MPLDGIKTARLFMICLDLGVVLERRARGTRRSATVLAERIGSEANNDDSAFLPSSNASPQH